VTVTGLLLLAGRDFSGDLVIHMEVGMLPRRRCRRVHAQLGGARLNLYTGKAHIDFSGGTLTHVRNNLGSG
jgi:hypothetical protein